MPDNDILSALKGMLGDDADEKINTVLNVLKNDSRSKIDIEDDIKVNKPNNNQDALTGLNKNLLSDEGLHYMTKIKDIIDEIGSVNDPRSNLLLSLKPYMREKRQKSIDNAVKLLNISRMSGIFKI